MSKNLYIVPFFGIGRKVTLDVEFRYREIGVLVRDVKVIEYAAVWAKSPFDPIYEKIEHWCSAMLVLVREAENQGYTLRGSTMTVKTLQRKLESILRLLDCGCGERASAVGDFLMVLHELHPSAVELF